MTALCASSGNTLAYGADNTARAAVTSYRVTGFLQDVTAVSRTQAWAVGWTGSTSPKTLLLHWNGQKWSPVTTPKPVAGQLLGLTKVSANDIWAAGWQGTTAATVRPLVLHYYAGAWHVLSGVPNVRGQFNSVGEAGKVLLAVGALNAPPMLSMERTGTTWKRFPVPSGAGDLMSLAVTGPASAWAAGLTVNTHTFIPNGDVLEHWNGSSWRTVSFPLHGTNRSLWRLIAGPGGAVWGVGDHHNNTATSYTPLSMLWNGRTWRQVTVTAPANSGLIAVTFIPGGTAWAGGFSANGRRSLLLHWSGTKWNRIPSPSPFTGTNNVIAVAATSNGDAWAVGAGRNTGADQTLILHWNGKAWS